MMADSVTHYVKATATLYFPENKVCCESCQLMGAEVLTARKYCKRSGEILTHTTAQIGYDCPLQFELEEINGTAE